MESDMFQKALMDYFYLIDKNYPEKGALKIVGDRYQLSADLRNVLYRSISSSLHNKQRSARLITKPDEKLIIDGYNVIFTLLNYRLGKFVFICSDQLCRDAGGIFGKIKNEQLFGECAGLLAGYLIGFKDIEIEIYLDSPVSHSLSHKYLLYNFFEGTNKNIRIEVVHSADYFLRQNSGGTLATSDSAIIDSCKNPILDLPHLILKKEYDVKLYDIGNQLQILFSI
jgi:hypothetical protein